LQRQIGHRQIGLVEQALCPLYARGLGDLRRAGADIAREKPRQMARADPEPRCEVLDRPIFAVERDLFDDQA